MAKKSISINRAPVLTLWAAVVARRMGFRKGEALTLGKAVAGLNAQSKGRRLGILKPPERKATREKPPDEKFFVEVCGRGVPAISTKDGIRATQKGGVISPASVERYLADKFGEDLSRAQKAMEKLAKSLPPRELAEQAYSLYEQFRPQIPAGEKGWGAEGELDLAQIERLASEE